MQKCDKARLIEAALRAQEGAYAPHSGFQVGAAVLTAGGKIILGANVESISYGLSCCAERVAIFKALTEGERDFVALAVVGEMAGGPTPCGTCRQLLIEHAPKAALWTADSREPENVREFTMEDLLPSAFVRRSGGHKRHNPRHE